MGNQSNFEILCPIFIYNNYLYYTSRFISDIAWNFKIIYCCHWSPIVLHFSHWLKTCEDISCIQTMCCPRITMTYIVAESEMSGHYSQVEQYRVVLLYTLSYWSSKLLAWHLFFVVVLLFLVLHSNITDYIGDFLESNRSILLWLIKSANT